MPCRSSIPCRCRTSPCWGVPTFLKPSDLEGIPLQVMALPWVSRSGLTAALQMSTAKPEQVFTELEVRLTELVNAWFEEAVDPTLPLVMTAHASVQGAKYGAERAVMLGSDLVLPGSLVCDPRLDYVALGHIHKPQNLNENAHPPVIYPGSIERVDFGEAEDDKFYIIADVQRGQTRVEWCKLPGRKFVDRYLHLTSQENIREQMTGALPPADELQDALVRLIVDYPYDWEPLLDETAVRAHASQAFEFHFVRRPRREARLRLPQEQGVGTYTPLELLDVYWKSLHTSAGESDELQKLAEQVIQSTLGERD